MFSLKLAQSKWKETSYCDKDDEIKFNPPVYEQRYLHVLKVLEHDSWIGTFKKITEFGCAEMRFFTFLKKLPGVEHIVQVDIDKETLRQYKKRVDPLLVDHLKQRETPLLVEVYEGSISTPHECLSNTDAVIGIEIIEHLNANILEDVPYNVFGFIQPKIAIFTTPNSEFNVFFRLNGFRHPDHKFEWTRNQFKDWCLNICKRYPLYKVAILGIGNGPPDKRNFGCVSQMCVFVRQDQSAVTMTKNGDLHNTTDNYRLVHMVQYPFFKDTRNSDEILLDDLKYHISRYTMGERWFHSERNIYELPLHLIHSLMYPRIFSVGALSKILTSNGYTVEGDLLIVQPEECPESSSEEDDFDGSANNSIDDISTGTLEEESWD